jgi:protoheme IX farnesyltransferase
MAAGCVAGTGLAVVSGAAGWNTAHRLLAGLALPWLVGLVAITWTSARRLLPSALVALLLFGLAAVLTEHGVHLVAASLAFAAAAFACARVFANENVSGGVGSVRDYVTLTKPRVMSLLLLTGGAAIFVGARGVPAWNVFALTMIGLALEFGVALSAFSFVLLDSLVNLPTALLALGGNLFYVFVYTRWLKRTTPQNIVIGGAAGAVPPLVGYAGAAGHLGWAALAMFGIVFLWTPPHFWALALMIREHYAKARVPMLPVVRGDRETARQIVFYTVALVAATLVPVAFGVFGLIYAISALALGAVFAWFAVRLWRDLTRARAVALFHFSLIYLALLFVAMALDAVA